MSLTSCIAFKLFIIHQPFEIPCGLHYICSDLPYVHRTFPHTWTCEHARQILYFIHKCTRIVMWNVGTCTTTHQLLVHRKSTCCMRLEHVNSLFLRILLLIHYMHIINIFKLMEMQFFNKFLVPVRRKLPSNARNWYAKTYPTTRTLPVCCITKYPVPPLCHLCRENMLVTGKNVAF